MNDKNGYIVNIEELTVENTSFRKVLYTTPEMQLVLMSLKPGEDIGSEVHPNITQFFRVEAGKGTVILNGVETFIEDGSSIVVPAGVEHNVVNTGDVDLKLYTLYTPPEHKHGVVQETKEEAEARHKDEQFDGTTSLN